MTQLCQVVLSCADELCRECVVSVSTVIDVGFCLGLRDQPNFTRGANYLLPMDVQLQVDLLRWQQRMEEMAVQKPGIQRKPKKFGR